MAIQWLYFCLCVSLVPPYAHARARAHARTHTRAHTHIHTYTHIQVLAVELKERPATQKAKVKSNHRDWAKADPNQQDVACHAHRLDASEAGQGAAGAASGGETASDLGVGAETEREAERREVLAQLRADLDRVDMQSAALQSVVADRLRGSSGLVSLGVGGGGQGGADAGGGDDSSNARGNDGKLKEEIEEFVRLHGGNLRGDDSRCESGLGGGSELIVVEPMLVCLCARSISLSHTHTHTHTHR